MTKCFFPDLSGFDSVQMQWFHNDTAVSYDTVKYQISDYGRRLKIKNPSAVRDGGVYTCEVRQQYSSLSGAKQKISVTVYGKPHWY